MRPWFPVTGAILCTVALASGKPRATLGAFPHFSFAPHEVVFTLRIEGPEVEKFYCPQIEWFFGDGSSSSTLSDCDPWESHEPSSYERIYTKHHKYWNPKEYWVVVILTSGKSMTKLVTNVVLAGDGANPTFASQGQVSERQTTELQPLSRGFDSRSALQE